MSITAVPATKTAQTSNTQSTNSVASKVLQLLQVYAQETGQDISSIFNILGATNLLGGSTNNLLGANSNTSIFDTNTPALPDDVAGLMGFQKYGTTGSPTLDSKSLTSLSTSEEEQIVAKATAGSVNTVLSMKIPPLPNQDKTTTAKK